MLLRDIACIVCNSSAGQKQILRAHSHVSASPHDPEILSF